MDKILEKQKLQKQTEEEMKILNRPIIHQEILLVIKNLPTKANPALHGFTGECNFIKSLKSN